MGLEVLLRTAVNFGVLEKVREYIDTFGLSYLEAWKNGYELLKLALENRHADVAELLLLKGSKVNSNDSFLSDTPLHLAASIGNIKIVEMILNKNAQIEAVDRDGRTPLVKAIQNKAIEAAELLVKHGANVNTIDHFGESPLHFAIESNHRELIIMLLIKGAAVNAKGKHGTTPLHLAVQGGYQENMIILLTEGADVNAKNESGITPLHLAVIQGYQEITTMLLEKGADANARQNDGKMPLHLACQEGFQEIMIILLTTGTDVNVKDESRITPLHLAVVKGDQKINTMLLSKGADVNAKSNDGVTPLHLAAHKGHHEITTMLLEKGAGVNAEQEDGTTPLHLAAVKGDQKIITTLLAKGADVNAKKNGLTPLHLALKHGGAETVIELLLQHGAKVDIEDKDSKTILYLAVEKGYLPVVENVLKYCPDINNPSNRSSIYAAILGNGDKHGQIFDALLKYGFIDNPEDTICPELIHKAVEKGYLKVVEDFLKYGVDVNIRDSINGFTPLQTAVKKRTASGSRRRSDANQNHDTIIEVEIAKLLLSKGANVDAKAKNGDTTLHYATRSGCASMVEALLEYNASVNAVNIFGDTPLHLAVEEGDLKIIVMLLAEGADVNAKKKGGTTPLHKAVVKEDLEIITILVKEGADVNAKEEDGSTPLHLAVQHCDRPLDIIDTILKFGGDINSTNNNSRTAFYLALEDRCEEIFKTFLDHRCNIDGVDCIFKVDGLQYDISPSDSDCDEDANFGGVTNDGRDTRCFIADVILLDEADDAYFPFSHKKKQVGIVQHHIVKMLAANLYVSEHQLSLVGDIIKHEMHDFYCECAEEIANMKSKKINNTIISFYDIFAKTTSSLANCMKNENVVQVFKSDYDTMFPIYGSMIKCNFRKSMERKELLEQGNNIFHFFVNSFAELPHECTEKIFSYLSNQDIIILIHAFKHQ